MKFRNLALILWSGILSGTSHCMEEKLSAYGQSIEIQLSELKLPSIKTLREHRTKKHKAKGNLRAETETQIAKIAYPLLSDHVRNGFGVACAHLKYDESILAKLKASAGLVVQKMVISAIRSAAWSAGGTYALPLGGENARRAVHLAAHHPHWAEIWQKYWQAAGPYAGIYTWYVSWENAWPGGWSAIKEATQLQAQSEAQLLDPSQFETAEAKDVLGDFLYLVGLRAAFLYVMREPSWTHSLIEKTVEAHVKNYPEWLGFRLQMDPLSQIAGLTSSEPYAYYFRPFMQIIGMEVPAEIPLTGKS